MTRFGVVLFYTTSAVMRAEKLLGKGGFLIKLIPTPRQFSSDCGIAMRFDWDNRDRVEAALKEAGLESAGVFPLDAG